MNWQKLLERRLAPAVGLLLGTITTAQAVVGDIPTQPPNGWNRLCTGNNIEVKPTVSTRTYTGTGTCWVNVAKDKVNAGASKWVNVSTRLSGSFDIKSGNFSESLQIDMPALTSSSFGDTLGIATKGTCTDDPWATGAQCSSSGSSLDLGDTFGWFIQPPAGPLSRHVFGAGLVAGLLAKQMSKPPLAPVDLEAVRWPAFDGKGVVGRVFWRVPDVSDNKWIMRFDIESAMNSPNGAFSKAGQVAGPGLKTELSPNEAIQFFWTPNKLAGGADYYFRVCSVNDAGRQCTAPMKARETTQMEQTGVASQSFSGGLGAKGSGGNPTPTAAATNRTGGFVPAPNSRGGSSNTSMAMMKSPAMGAPARAFAGGGLTGNTAPQSLDLILIGADGHSVAATRQGAGYALNGDLACPMKLTVSAVIKSSQPAQFLTPLKIALNVPSGSAQTMAPVPSEISSQNGMHQVRVTGELALPQGANGNGQLQLVLTQPSRSERPGASLPAGALASASVSANAHCKSGIGMAPSALKAPAAPGGMLRAPSSAPAQPAAPASLPAVQSPPDSAPASGSALKKKTILSH